MNAWTIAGLSLLTASTVCVVVPSVVLAFRNARDRLGYLERRCAIEAAAERAERES